MNKIILGIFFLFLTILNGREIIGTYITYEDADDGTALIWIKIDGVEKIYNSYSLYPDNKKLLKIHKNEPVLMQLSDGSYKMVENVYFKDGSNLIGAKEVYAKFVRFNTDKHLDGKLIFEFENKEIVFIGYDLNIALNKENMYYVTYIMSPDKLKVIESISLESKKNAVVKIKEYTEKKKVNYFTDNLDENEKACNNGDTQKCYELALENAGFLEAPGYYNKACEGGHAKACYELAGIYELGNRAVEKDVELSKKFYRMSCKGGYSDACSVVKKLDERSKNISEKMNSGISGGDLNLKCESDIFYYTRNNNTSMWRKKKNDIKPSFFFKIIDNKNSLMFAMEGRTYNLPKNRVENNTVVYMKSPSSNAYIDIKLDINKINSNNNSIIPGVFDVHTNGEVTQMRLKCKSVSAGEIKGKRLTFYEKLNAKIPSVKGIKPIDSRSNVLVADNSAKCMLVGKLSSEHGLLNVPFSETIAWGKAPLDGMTKSVIYLDNRKYFFKEAHYEDGLKLIDEYESIGTRNRYNLWRVSGGTRTFFIIPGLNAKKFVLECYYTR